MATSTLSAISVSSSSSLKARVFNNSASFNSQNPFCFNPLASPHTSSVSYHRLLSRNLCKVRATVLQEYEEKVVVEESFPPKSFPDDKGNGRHGEPPEGSSSSITESWVIKVEQSINIFLTDSVIKILDTLYHDRNYPRFFVLETIARVPYFAFISVLHFYESFGWWRRADYLKVHFAESWNEMHHLLIMEELGGNAWWFDRFLAQHIATFYYFMTVFMYALSPRMAYHFSECVENHAYETYDKFIKAEGEELKKLPAPKVAVKYYTGGDLYLFDEFQTARVPNTRRPKIENLYDVFLNIRDDEAEHCKTMKACQTHGNLRSPHSYLDDSPEDDSGCTLPEADCEASKKRFKCRSSVERVESSTDDGEDLKTGIRRKNLAVFVSGGGSNLRSIHEATLSGAVHGGIVVLVTNKHGCGGAEYARDKGIPVVLFPKMKDDPESLSSNDLVTALRTYKVDFILLAGYVKLIPSELISAYPRSILNIHPSLLPAFGGKGCYGMKVHKAVIASGARYSGPTIHFVDEKYDTGRILAQRVVPVLANDIAEDLGARVLCEEHQLYVEVASALCEERIIWREDGVPLIQSKENPNNYS